MDQGRPQLLRDHREVLDRRMVQQVGESGVILGPFDIGISGAVHDRTYILTPGYDPYGFPVGYVEIDRIKAGDFADVSEDEAEEIAGKGVKATVDGKVYYCGNGKLMEMCGADWHECHLTGTIIHVAREVDGNTEYLGHIVINDQVKEDSAAAISELKGLGVKRLVMLTGDKKNVAEGVAERLGITDCYSELLPADKVAKVEDLIASETGKLAFVGDGINDAPVLMRADCGIAMGAMGSDAAIESADIVLMDDKPSKIADAVKLSRKTMRIVWENIIFALGVKAIILVLGALGIANMWFAVFGDVGVLIIAVLNAMRCMRRLNR